MILVYGRYDRKILENALKGYIDNLSLYGQRDSIEHKVTQELLEKITKKNEVI
jgi:hypothetical protein